MVLQQILVYSTVKNKQEVLSRTAYKIFTGSIKDADSSMLKNKLSIANIEFFEFISAYIVIAKPNEEDIASSICKESFPELREELIP
jgi:hypothetical protein